MSDTNGALRTAAEQARNVLDLVDLALTMDGRSAPATALDCVTRASAAAERLIPDLVAIKDALVGKALASVHPSP